MRTYERIEQNVMGDYLDGQQVRDAETQRISAENFGRKTSGRYDPVTQTYSEPSTSWSDALARQQQDARAREMKPVLDDQMSIEQEISSTGARMRQQEARQQVDIQNALASAMKHSEGGALPEYVRGIINRRYGWDGQTSGVLPGSGMQQDGNYVFNVVGPNGQQAVSFSPTQRFQLAQAMRGIYNDADRAQMRQGLLDAGMSEAEVSKMEFDPFSSAVDRIVSKEVDASTNDGARQQMEQRAAEMRARPSGGKAVASVEANGKVARALFGRGGDNRSVISSFSSDGRGGFSESYYNGHTGERSSRDWGTRDSAYSGRWKVLRSGPDGTVYENDKTGETLTTKNGESIKEVLSRMDKKDNGKSGQLTFDQRKQLQDERLAAQSAQHDKDQQAISDRANASIRERDLKSKVSAILTRIKANRTKRGNVSDEELEKSLQGQLQKLLALDEDSSKTDDTTSQAVAPKEDNTGNEDTSPKPGDVIGTLTKGGKTYEVYIGEDGKKHARPQK